MPLPCLIALLLFVAAEAAAQAPPHALALSPSTVHAFAQEHEMDLQALRASQERPERWMLYGRLGPMNFANPLDGDGGGVQVSLRRNGQGLSGKIYLGIRRRF